MERCPAPTGRPRCSGSSRPRSRRESRPSGCRAGREVCRGKAGEKNRQGSMIAIRDDRAADLRQWLAEKLERLQADQRDNGGPIPMRLPETEKVFQVPEKLSKILNRDLQAAGIAKKDEQGRQI